MSQLPFPSNNNVATSLRPAKPSKDPWTRCKPGEPPDMMFQVRFYDGRIISYAYADLREIRLQDAGCITLCIFGFEKYEITVEGRHLGDLAALLGSAAIKSLTEFGPRSFERSEELPCIDKIAVTTLAN